MAGIYTWIIAKPGTHYVCKYVYSVYVMFVPFGLKIPRVHTSLECLQNIYIWYVMSKDIHLYPPYLKEKSAKKNR